MVKISIIIATFNAGKILLKCLDSIIPQLSSVTELVIIDGGSKDNTLEIIEKYRRSISYIVSERDKGIYDAWNKGIKVANGEWIMFLGADDVLLPNALSSYLDYLQNGDYSNFDLISSKCKLVAVNGKEVRTFGSLWTWSQCIKGVQISHPGALQNKTFFEEVGLYNLDYHISADYELLLRKADKLKTSFMNVFTVQMREGGMSYSYKSINEYYNIIKRCPKVTPLYAFVLWVNMVIRFAIKTQFRKIGINIHS